jgi:hypothetical protein
MSSRMLGKLASPLSSIAFCCGPSRSTLFVLVVLVPSLVLEDSDH